MNQSKVNCKPVKVQINDTKKKKKNLCSPSLESFRLQFFKIGGVTSKKARKIEEKKKI